MFDIGSKNSVISSFWSVQKSWSCDFDLRKIVILNFRIKNCVWSVILILAKSVILWSWNFCKWILNCGFFRFLNYLWFLEFTEILKTSNISTFGGKSVIFKICRDFEHLKHLNFWRIFKIGHGKDTWLSLLKRAAVADFQNFSNFRRFEQFGRFSRFLRLSEFSRFSWFLKYLWFLKISEILQTSKISTFEEFPKSATVKTLGF